MTMEWPNSEVGEIEEILPGVWGYTKCSALQAQTRYVVRWATLQAWARWQFMGEFNRG